MSRGVLLALAGAVAVGVVAGVLLVRGSGAPPRPPALERMYRDVDVCLLTDAGGVESPLAAPVWAGMEDVSSAKLVRAMYLPVPYPGTESAAVPVLGSLLVGHCRVIVAVGGPERAAVLAQARRFPSVQFVVFGASPGLPSNVRDLAFVPSGVRASVAAVVGELVSLIR